MKLFKYREIREAYAYVREGGQALHVQPNSFAYKDIPICFKKSKQWGHLFDQDKERLVKTAKRLGVRVIKVENAGDEKRQHIDLCGKPLERAIEECVS